MRYTHIAADKVEEGETAIDPREGWVSMDTNRSSDGDDGSERAVEGFEGRAVGDDDGPANDLEKSKRRAKFVRRVHTRAV